MSLKVIYAGTPEFSVAALQAIEQSSHQVVAVYTQPDRPAGRGKKLTPSPVKEFALQQGFPVFQPATLKTDEQLEQLKALNADVMVVTAYGLILPKAVLEAFRFGCINIHASLLPRWRGAAPIQRAIEAGDAATGVTIMQMDEGLDTGAMLLTQSLPITMQTTAESLHDELMILGAAKISKILDHVENNTLSPIAQNDSQSCYAKKLIKSEGHINWALPASEIDRRIRAFYPWPGSVAMKNGQAIKIHRAKPLAVQHKTPGQVIKHDQDGLLVACGEGSMLIEQIQIPGKKRLYAKDLAHSKNWSGELFDEFKLG